MPPETILNHISNPLKNDHVWEEGFTSRDAMRKALRKKTYVHTLCGIRFYPKNGQRPTKVCPRCMDVALTVTE